MRRVLRLCSVRRAAACRSCTWARMDICSHAVPTARWKSDSSRTGTARRGCEKLTCIPSADVAAARRSDQLSRPIPSVLDSRSNCQLPHRLMTYLAQSWCAIWQVVTVMPMSSTCDSLVLLYFNKYCLLVTVNRRRCQTTCRQWICRCILSVMLPLLVPLL